MRNLIMARSSAGSFEGPMITRMLRVRVRKSHFVHNTLIVRSLLYHQKGTHPLDLDWPYLRHRRITDGRGLARCFDRPLTRFQHPNPVRFMHHIRSPSSPSDLFCPECTRFHAKKDKALSSWSRASTRPRNLSNAHP